MSDSTVKPAQQEQEEEKLVIHGEVERLAGLTIFVVLVTLLTLLVLMAVHGQSNKWPSAQQKYFLKSRCGIAFSDFRGY